MTPLLKLLDIGIRQTDYLLVWSLSFLLLARILQWPRIYTSFFNISLRSLLQKSTNSGMWLFPWLNLLMRWARAQMAYISTWNMVVKDTSVRVGNITPKCGSRSFSCFGFIHEPEFRKLATFSHIYILGKMTRKLFLN